MSEVIKQKNAIILATAEKLVELGEEVAQRMVEGKDSPAALSDGQKMLVLMRAYTMHEELEDAEVEALLYCMRKLSGAYEFPTAEPLVGKSITNVVEQTVVGIGLDPAPNSVIWSDGVSWQVITLQELWNKLMAL